MMPFYVLGKIEVGPFETLFLPMEPDHTGEARYCPDCDASVSALAWLPPFRARIDATRGKLGDLAHGVGGCLLVSERFRKAWEERQLKGIPAFTPLERIRVRPARLGKPSPVYYVIAPQLYGAKIDFARSHFTYGGIITCETCRSMKKFKAVNGFAIEEGTWTGEDIFRAWGFPGTVLVTDRVRQLRDDYDLKNVELTPIEEYHLPEFNVQE